MGKTGDLVFGFESLEPIDLVCLNPLPTLVTAMQDQVLEAVMLLRSYFLHYRLIREAISVVGTVGTALLFSYLILQN
jgi:hypothetical protein